MGYAWKRKYILRFFILNRRREGILFFSPICRAVIHRGTPCAKLYLYTLKADKKPFPPATDPADIETHGRDFTTLIEWDEEAYLRRTDNRSVKKTLTISAWMDTLARERNINFSQLLQNAIRRECGMEA